MGYLLKQSQTARPLLFLMIDSADHISPKTGLSPTVTISKNGGSFASPSGAVSEVGSGWYKVAANATDTNTLGPLLLHATGAGADPTDELFEVVSFDAEDGAGLGLSRVDAAITTRATPAEILATPANLLATAVGGGVTVGSGGITASSFAAGAIDAASVAADAIGASELAAGAVAEIAAAILATPANLLATDGGGGVTVGTNSDKTGYRLSATGVDDILDDSLSEPVGVFAWGTATPRKILAWLGALARNKMTQTSSTQTLRNDADSASLATATHSDDGTTYTRGEWV